MYSITASRDHNELPGFSVPFRLDLMAAYEMIVREVEFVCLALGAGGTVRTLARVEGVAGERGDRPQLALRCDSLLLLSPGKHT